MNSDGSVYLNIVEMLFMTEKNVNNNCSIIIRSTVHQASDNLDVFYA